MDMNQKYQNLKKYIKDLGSLAVAFSGGVDSTFLLKVARDVLGERVVAITVMSQIFPNWESHEALQLVKDIGVPHYVINYDGLNRPWFVNNPKDRCYHCKKEVFTFIWQKARELGIDNVADGTNYDDLGDYRPGLKAVKELQVVSPLKEAKMTKDDIRQLSRELNIPTWDKPSYACLASRIPYGVSITKEKLAMVEKAEDFLRSKGFRQLRVRYHNDIARIEVAPSERKKFFHEEFMDQVSIRLKELGFTYVTLELEGYHTGSMNKMAGEKEEI